MINYFQIKKVSPLSTACEQGCNNTIWKYVNICLAWTLCRERICMRNWGMWKTRRSTCSELLEEEQQVGYLTVNLMRARKTNSSCLPIKKWKNASSSMTLLLKPPVCFLHLEFWCNETGTTGLSLVYYWCIFVLKAKVVVWNISVLWSRNKPVDKKRVFLQRTAEQYETKNHPHTIKPWKFSDILPHP